MKSFIAVLVVVLALAHGSQSAEVGDIQKFFEDMQVKLSAQAAELSEKINAQDLVGQAQTYIEQGKTHLEPLAAQIQEQLKPLQANVEEHLKPLGDKIQAELKPLVDNFQVQMEEIFRKLMDQAKAIGN